MGQTLSHDHKKKVETQTSSPEVGSQENSLNESESPQETTALNKKLKPLAVDPRSPSGCIPRTPIVVEAGGCDSGEATPLNQRGKPDKVSRLATAIATKTRLQYEDQPTDVKDSQSSSQRPPLSPISPNSTMDI